MCKHRHARTHTHIHEMEKKNFSNSPADLLKCGTKMTILGWRDGSTVRSTHSLTAFLEKTQVQVPAPTQQVKTVEDLTPSHIHASKTPTHIK